MNAIEKYKTATVSTSNTTTQMIFIYDELTKLLLQAQKAIEDKAYETKFKNLAKVIEVFYILKSGLPQDSSDEAIKIMDNFYGATINILENANMKGESPEEIQPAIDAIKDIKTSLSSLKE
ncbi:MAG: flagellar protein FliS [Rickettsiales bacterium]|nr:flagellar protein FliS [Rickettsiales bacterium]MCA0254914.1 flagellar protein FliS [Pseudomonadota bacterium]